MTSVSCEVVCRTTRHKRFYTSALLLKPFRSDGPGQPVTHLGSTTRGQNKRQVADEISSCTASINCGPPRTNCAILRMIGKAIAAYRFGSVCSNLLLHKTPVSSRLGALRLSSARIDKKTDSRSRRRREMRPSASLIRKSGKARRRFLPEQE